MKKNPEVILRSHLDDGSTVQQVWTLESAKALTTRDIAKHYDEYGDLELSPVEGSTRLSITGKVLDISPPLVEGRIYRTAQKILEAVLGVSEAWGQRFHRPRPSYTMEREEEA